MNYYAGKRPGVLVGRAGSGRDLLSPIPHHVRAVAASTERRFDKSAAL